MDKIESIFQKINRENYDLKNHKENLRLSLINSKYFNSADKKFSWDFKMVFSSVSFSAIVIIGIFLLSPKTVNQTNHVSTLPLYDRLLTNNNSAKVYAGGGNMQIIEVSQENIKTVLYFDNNKKLVNSQISK